MDRIIMGPDIGEKSKRVTLAVYLVTSLITDIEPLKRHMRELALKIDEATPSLEAVDLIKKITKFFDIATQARIVSEMNSSLIKKEYLNLTSSILGQQIDHPPEAPQVNPDLKDVRNKASLPKKDMQMHQIVRYKPEPFESRSGLIMTFIKPDRRYSVKDIAILVPDVSEKTVQRELVSLVAKGVLKKVGERRWSRYSRIA